MVKKRDVRDRALYSCEVCDLAYNSLEVAQACEDYCNEHHGCSIEITKKAVSTWVG